MTTLKVGAKRLTKLADELAARVKAKKYQFCMATWVGDDPKTDSTEVHCGTAGCAIGLCPAIWPKHWRYVTTMTGYTAQASDGAADNYGSASRFFGIKDSEAVRLFDFYSYTNDIHKAPPVRTVIARIRKQARKMLKPKVVK